MQELIKDWIIFGKRKIVVVEDPEHGECYKKMKGIEREAKIKVHKNRKDAGTVFKKPEIVLAPIKTNILEYANWENDLGEA